jgi:hypothetical protein
LVHMHVRNLNSIIDTIVLRFGFVAYCSLGGNCVTYFHFQIVSLVLAFF